MDQPGQIETYLYVADLLNQSFCYTCQAVELAKEYTGSKKNTTAIDKFIKEMQAQDMYFNDKPFPLRESGEEAFVNCFDNKSAEDKCPERYKAMKAWLKNTDTVSN